MYKIYFIIFEKGLFTILGRLDEESVNSGRKILSYRTQLCIHLHVINIAQVLNFLKLLSCS